VRRAVRAGTVVDLERRRRGPLRGRETWTRGTRPGREGPRGAGGDHRRLPGASILALWSRPREARRDLPDELAGTGVGGR
jgi:hypothetical protein